MIKVVGYLTGVPPGIKNQRKRDIITNFISGVRVTGDSGTAVNSSMPSPCDVAFIQGWVHEASSDSPHLIVRKSVIDFQKRNGNRTLVVDSNLFNYADPKNKDRYLRYSFDGVFPTTGNYFRDFVDPTRWQKISKDQGIVLKEWRKEGNHILICTQRNGGWSMKGLSVTDWLNQTVNEIRQYSDRTIVVRGHPGDKNSQIYLRRNNLGGKYMISDKPLLTNDLKNAHCVITYNSSPGVAAAIEGIPVFVTDPVPQTSQAFEVSNHSLSKLENPDMYDRQQWIENLSMSHWTAEEATSGQAWRHIKKFI